MCPPPTTCGGRLQRLFADWIPAFAGMTDGACGMANETYGMANETYGMTPPDVMPGLTRHPVDKTSRRDTYN